ncbi:HAD family phosphatase [Ulvibacterium sp.]|uniref:HAD family hydrolase n=1 Tax=Ulvibacterium sp. TaxID=2665914 RepID=UPI0026050F3B|nr:HAD family phosphatase [Ulvibacterium sp.]
MIKGVIFDFNGTLFYDTHLHDRAWDLFLANRRLELSNSEKSSKMHGKNNSQIFKGLFEEELSKEEIKNLILEKENLYQELCLQGPMELAPGAIEFLEFLGDQEIPFTIATASDRYNVDFYFKNLPLTKYFEFDKVIYNDGTIPSKPSPEIFMRAMQVLNILPEETMILEDSISGIKAAENSNAKTIIIADSAEHDYEEMSHQRIKHFDEINRGLFKI